MRPTAHKIMPATANVFFDDFIPKIPNIKPTICTSKPKIFQAITWEPLILTIGTSNITIPIIPKTRDAVAKPFRSEIFLISFSIN